MALIVMDLGVYDAVNVTGVIRSKVTTNVLD